MGGKATFPEKGEKQTLGDIVHEGKRKSASDERDKEPPSPGLSSEKKGKCSNVGNGTAVTKKHQSGGGCAGRGRGRKGLVRAKRGGEGEKGYQKKQGAGGNTEKGNWCRDGGGGLLNLSFIGGKRS